MSTWRARRLPQHLGPAAWDAILPGRVPGPALATDTAVDFAVIGAGFAGLAAARRLTQLAPGSRIAILEAGRLAEGACGRNSGFMIDLPHDLTSADYAGPNDDKTQIALNRQAIAFARQAVEDYGIARDFFDPAGKINGAVSTEAEAHNTSYAAHLGRLGEGYERLDARQMQEITGSRHYRSGLYTPGTVMLQPAGFVRGMASGLRDAGVQVFENTPALGFAKASGGWRIDTPRARLETAKIILTVNGHLESFGFAVGRVMHVFLFAAMTRELDRDALERLGGHDRWGITPSDPMGTTMRRIDTGQGGNRLVTRTCAVLRSGMRAREADMRRAARVMRRKFDSRFPSLAGMKMEHTWAGHLSLSGNGVAVMREIDDGLFAGCMQNGLGTARGTLTGMGAAELACGFESALTRHFTAQDEPSKLPPRMIRDFSANAVLRWREWVARSE